ncbi:hypothetical protein [Micromonospora antibiotica]|uniref:Uncharacterized protein n=1 Tax=Micromonospora antibiotica TaxID=2807623 RepID=A0ABS3VFG9_9ACTN|nr:hypothetical protein [Micromonospora antibiotica]MBO4164292.1 hypothetical protein [Micromonospora antibiotica]
MSALRPAERVIIAHVCQDWAATYHSGPLRLTINDTVRYLSDGHLEDLTARHGRKAIWQAVAAHLQDHPATLTTPRTTAQQRDQRQTERDARAAAHLDAARHHHRQELPFEALALIDRAEMCSPRFTDFDKYRATVHRRFPLIVTTRTDGTDLRYRHTLTVASHIPGAPVAYHGTHQRLWVYPGRKVIEGPWPAAIPEQCTADETASRWLAHHTVLVCTGCGLDMT